MAARARPTACQDGWSDVHNYDYLVSPNEKRDVSVATRSANGVYTVAIDDSRPSAASAAPVALVSGGSSRRATRASRSPARRRTRSTRPASSSASGSRTRRRTSDVPGVAIGLIQDGKVVFAGGFGVRELGKPGKVDEDTLYMIASNTKAHDHPDAREARRSREAQLGHAGHQGRPRVQARQRGDDRQVLVKHLVCACTGLPRQDSSGSSSSRA